MTGQRLLSSAVSHMMSSMDFREAEAIAALLVIAGTFGWIAVRVTRNGARRVREWEAYRMLESADAAAQSGEVGEALRLAQEAEEREPRVQQIVRVQLGIACICLAAGQPRNAIERIRRAVSIVGSDKVASSSVIDHFCSSALAFHVAELYPEAEQLLRKAIEGVPDDIPLKSTLGGLLYELGRSAEALPLLQLAHASPPDASNRGIVAAYLSAIASNHGDVEEAKRFREEALEVLPDHPIVERVLGIGRSAQKGEVPLR